MPRHPRPSLFAGQSPTSMSSAKPDAESQGAATNGAQSAPVPRDVRLMSLILASMGIDDAEPAVLVQLLEFANRAWRRRMAAGD